MPDERVGVQIRSLCRDGARNQSARPKQQLPRGKPKGGQSRHKKPADSILPVVAPILFEKRDCLRRHRYSGQILLIVDTLPSAASVIGVRLYRSWPQTLNLADERL